jgi:hypothetical protein
MILICPFSCFQIDPKVAFPRRAHPKVSKDQLVFTNRFLRIYDILTIRMMKMRTVYKILVRKPEGMKPLWRHRREQVDNNKMDIREIGLEGVDWFLWLGIQTVGGLLRTDGFISVCTALSNDARYFSLLCFTGWRGYFEWTRSWNTWPGQALTP